jgi:hypothetical protein
VVAALAVMIVLQLQEVLLIQVVAAVVPAVQDINVNLVEQTQLLVQQIQAAAVAAAEKVIIQAAQIQV